MTALGDGLRLALGTFTVVPTRPVAPVPAVARVMMLSAPLVGAALGATAAAAMRAADAVLPAGAAAHLTVATLGVGAVLVGSRALHVDGLADTADGLGSMRPAAEARAVMRTGGSGPFGVATVVLVLLLQVSALAVAVGAGRGAPSALIAVTTGRLAATLGCRRGIAAAEPDGLGAAVAETVPWVAALCAVAPVTAGAAAFAGTDGVIAVAAGVLAGEALRRHAVRRLGGITGDVLGAAVETATTTALLALAMTA